MAEASSAIRDSGVGTARGGGEGKGVGLPVTALPPFAKSGSSYLAPKRGETTCVSLGPTISTEARTPDRVRRGGREPWRASNSLRALVTPNGAASVQHGATHTHELPSVPVVTEIEPQHPEVGGDPGLEVRVFDLEEGVVALSARPDDELSEAVRCRLACGVLLRIALVVVLVTVQHDVGTGREQIVPERLGPGWRALTMHRPRIEIRVMLA